MTRLMTPGRAALGAFMLLGALLGCAAARAQLSAPNGAGVAMGHLHYAVADVAAEKGFWLALGGTETTFGSSAVVRFPDVLVFLREGAPDAGSEGSVVNHVAFRVQSLAAIAAAGFDVIENEDYPGVAYVYAPSGERIELFDDERATNLTFTRDDGRSDAVSDRHNHRIDVPIIAHHIHLYVPEGEVEAAKDWYVEQFGAVAGMRWRYPAADLPGINLNFSAGDAAAPTRGRRLDHIGFEVDDLEAFCATLEARGIELDRPYTKLESGLGLAFLTDPWGTYIELTEGLRDL
jgi:catechol 2,3-dioxygenase-like lactoylglutathione lyase family enzyme